MEAKANAKFVRISPRKVNVVLDLVRGKDVKYAEAVLKHTPKAACEPLLKLLNSAMANAENNHDMMYPSFTLLSAMQQQAPSLKEFVREHRAERSESTRELLTSPSFSRKKKTKGRFKYGSES